MDKKEFLKSKEIENRLENQQKKIRNSIALSTAQKSAGIALSTHKTNIYSYYSISENSSIYSSTKNIFYGEKYKKHSKLYSALFDKKTSDVIINCLERLDKVMYQSSYDKRSFRAPNLESLTTARRIEFITSLNRYLQYDMSIEEYFRYNMGYNKYFWIYVSELSKKDEKIFDSLIDGVYSRHEFIVVSKELIGSLLYTNDIRAFEAIKDLLLAAQRQEGLRQTILESLDETTVEAQRYFMKVILDENLIRFSSVKRALFTWCGIAYDAQRESTVKKFIELGYEYLNSSKERQDGINSQDNAECYMALWAKGCFDIESTYNDLHMLYDEGDLHKKLLALKFANETKLTKIYYEMGKKAVLSDNLKVFIRGVRLIKGIMYKNGFSTNREDIVLNRHFSKDEIIEIFNNAMTHYKTIKKNKIEIDEEYFEFAKYVVYKSELSTFMYRISKYDNKMFKEIVEIFPDIDANTRYTIVRGTEMEMKNKSRVTEETINIIFHAIKDRSSNVRKIGFEAIKKIRLTQEQQIQIEELLKTKNSSYRKAIISTLLNMDTSNIKKSVDRLLDNKSEMYNLGALDILNQMKAKDVENRWVMEKAKYYKENIKTNDQAEILLKNILGGEDSVLEYSHQNGFGLYDVNYPKDYSRIEKIDEKKLKNMHLSRLEVAYVTEQITRLYELVEENSGYEYETEAHGIKQKVMLGNRFDGKSQSHWLMNGEKLFNDYPLPEVWKEWYVKSGLTPRQLFLSSLYLTFDNEYWQKRIDGFNTDKMSREAYNLSVFGIGKINFPASNSMSLKRTIIKILDIVQEIYPYNKEEAIDFYQMQIQHVISGLDRKELISQVKSPFGRFSRNVTVFDRLSVRHLNMEYLKLVSDMNNEQLRKCVNLYSYVGRSQNDYSEKQKEVYGYGLSMNVLCRAFELGIISEDELIENLLTPNLIGEIRNKPYRHQTEFLKKYPFLIERLDKISQRILDIETARGDAATNVSYLACRLEYVRGIENYVKILKALGKSGLHSGHMWSGVNASDSKKKMMSFLLRQSKPRENEDYTNFKEIADRYKISRTKLIESAVYNPIWVPFVKEYLGIEYFESAVWWIYAHTNGAHNLENVSEIGKYSKIELADFRNGAVDVDWFKNIYNKIDCWDEIYRCGKYVTEGNGHTRAQLFADAILGKVNIEDAKKKVDATRNKDNLRIIGLIPLGKNKKAELLDRYNYIQKFAKQSKQFGAQRQSSEKIAVQIAVDNLARTGGYLDTMRFVWNMETENTIDILNKSQNVKVGDILVSIIVGEDGRAKLQVQKGDKIQKTIPAKHKNSEQIKEMKAFVKDLNAQGKRVSKSMEEAMINMDYFEADEIKKLMRNPVINPVLSKLVIKAGDDLGFYIDGNIVGKNQRAIQKDEKVYIAHCYDLYKSDDWGYFQEKCFKDKIKQPFKQIFRELYVPTEDELQEKSISRRYAGYQVATNKTFALLKSRGWQVNYEEGLLKYFKKQNIIVNMFATANWFTPAEIEAPTLEIIQFLDANKGERMAFEDIEPIIFSETMRDIDLVVSVAYVGGVDPEASHSTVEMRRALINETAKLFKLDNYKLKDNHVIINGHYGEYSVHLGSGVVHKILGAHLSIIPVHSGQRGRLFLPFMDNDPKSAEILSKVLLLCRDKSIKDPTILRQIE